MSGATALAAVPDTLQGSSVKSMGPLTIPQAEWRNHNLKPAREVRTK